MQGVHVNWTAPFFERHRLRGHGFKITRTLDGQAYELNDYQILYTMVSALRWKLHNGPIKLYTDSIGLSFYKQLGIEGIYDEINIDVLNQLEGIDPAYFWTSGKIHAIGHETEPFVFLDQDFIVREKFEGEVFNSDLAIGHWEIPRGQYYFTKEQWEQDIKHISFPENYNVYAYAPNTSFIYFGNMKALNEYVEWHKKMVTINTEVPEWFWLATDQGIFGHVIREGKYSTYSLTDKVFLADNEYGNKDTQKYGHSEMWYYPMDCDKSKDDYGDYSVKSPWEHVWLAKIVCGINPEFMASETQRYFDEAWFHGGKQFLNHPRFTKYWKKEIHGF